MTRFFVFSVAFVIAGCVQAQNSDDTCDSSGFQGLVGQTGEIARLLRLPEQQIRVIPHNGIVTTDYRTDRMNIELDENDMIVRISCG